MRFRYQIINLFPKLIWVIKLQLLNLYPSDIFVVTYILTKVFGRNVTCQFLSLYSSFLHVLNSFSVRFVINLVMFTDAAFIVPVCN